MADEQRPLFPEILDDIKRRHREDLIAASARGQVRALELLWQEVNQDELNVTVPSWTDRERGMMKDLFERYGDDEIAMVIKWAVRKWTSLSGKIGQRFPAFPVFSDFYFHRDRVWAEYRADQAREEHQRKAVETNHKDHEKYAEWKRESEKVAPAKTLTEMVMEARAKVREMKEAGIPLPRS